MNAFIEAFQQFALDMSEKLLERDREFAFEYGNSQYTTEQRLQDAQAEHEIRTEQINAHAAKMCEEMELVSK